MRNFFLKYPAIFAFFVLIVSRIIGISVIKGVQFFSPTLSIQEDLGWMLQLLYLGSTLLLIYYFSNFEEVGLRMPFKREWLVWIPTLIIPISILFEFGIKLPDSFIGITILLMSAFGVAANEEIIFRGIFMNAFMKRSIFQAVIIPAGIFGLLHLPNLFLGTDIKFSIFQTCWAFIGGIALGAMRIRNNSLIPVILFHFLVDANEYLATGEIGIHPNIISTTFLLIFIGLTIVFSIYASTLLAIQQNQKINTTRD